MCIRDRHYNAHGTLAPNIASYTPAIVKKDNEFYGNVHIIHAIGYAFDKKKQSDYKYFFTQGRTKADIVNELISRYRRVFRKIYYCAKELELKKVVMSLVGANNFADLFEGNNNKMGRYAFQEQVWVPAFLAEQKMNSDIETVFMGSGGSKAVALLENKFKVTDIGRFPNNIDKVDTETTLFVNAWDMLSLPGNGNSADGSLDGYVGRVSNIAVIGTPMTNPYVQYVAVD